MAPRKPARPIWFPKYPAPHSHEERLRHLMVLGDHAESLGLTDVAEMLRAKDFPAWNVGEGKRFHKGNVLYSPQLRADHLWTTPKWNEAERTDGFNEKQLTAFHIAHRRLRSLPTLFHEFLMHECDMGDDFHVHGWDKGVYTHPTDVLRLTYEPTLGKFILHERPRAT